MRASAAFIIVGAFLLPTDGYGQSARITNVCAVARALALAMNANPPGTELSPPFKDVQAIADCDTKVFRQLLLADRGSRLNEEQWARALTAQAKACNAPFQKALADAGWSSQVEVAYPDGSRNGPDELCM